MVEALHNDSAKLVLETGGRHRVQAPCFRAGVSWGRSLPSRWAPNRMANCLNVNNNLLMESHTTPIILWRKTRRWLSRTPRRMIRYLPTSGAAMPFSPRSHIDNPDWAMAIRKTS